MNKTGFIPIFISLYLLSFITSDCYTTVNVNKKEECFKLNLTDYDKIIYKESLGKEADTCCMVKYKVKALGQSADYKYCEPLPKEKAKDYENKLEEGFGTGNALADMDYTVDCYSSFIKYGLSFLMILLLN